MLKKYKLTNNFIYLIDCMRYEHLRGVTLFEIYETLKEVWTKSEAQVIFHNFIKINKKNESFMEEFNKTVFNLN